MNNDLMQKLMVAKQIMNVHDKKPRGGVGAGNFNTPMVESFNSPPATYNIPQEFMSQPPQQMVQENNNLPVKDKILNSKLPDHIKKLMIEHPIEQPNTNNGSVLSNELVEAASRLMKTDAAGKIPTQKSQPQQTQHQSNNFDINLLKSVIKETIEEVLTEKGMIAESTQKTKEQISFRVGQHVFEGVVTKIKKMKN